LVIEVADDGHGLNPEAILASAIRKGLVSADASLTDEQIYDVLFMAGFSTKETVSDVSGRGVGLDVVKTNLKDLHGEIETSSELGKGTKFVIQLPLTLAIIDGLVIRSSGQKFIVPLSQVSESLTCSSKDIRTVPGLGRIVTLRDEEIFFYPFSELIGQEDTQSQDLTVIIVRGHKGDFAFGVDEVVGRQQIVIKQLGPDVPSVAGVSGASILSDGRPTLIVDLVEFINLNGDPKSKSVEKRRRKVA
jgi:two-component system chemotaxis sensor kinase CheA